MIFPIHKSGKKTVQKCEGKIVIHVATTKKGQVFPQARTFHISWPFHTQMKYMVASSQTRVLEKKKTHRLAELWEEQI
jgi:deoxyxylulose-5-phosphate synthase